MVPAAHLAYHHILMTLILVIGFPSAENKHQVDVRRLCNSQVTCASCIGADVQCSWCYDYIYQNERCDQPDKHINQGCNENKILNPSLIEVPVKDDPLSDEHEKKILMKPQKIRLKMRPHEMATVPLKFYTTKDHAVDLYFLMDLSYTMDAHIEELSQVSMKLVANIRNLTGSLLVGIGSFVDKITQPYGYCPSGKDEKDKWSCGYTFNQRLNLTDNFKEFTHTVSRLRNMTTLYNYDTPEGGLDALMQAIVCEDEIGWRENSRKLIIFCSDAPFHFAGDGKLSGIVVPNDGKCHMKNNVYTKEYLQDYPSVDHIAQIVQKNKVTVIFAIAGQEYQQLYHQLSDGLTSSYVNELGNKKSTIASIVTEGYKNITSTVEMIAENDKFKVDFLSNCTSGKWIKSHKCRTKLGEEVDFRAIIIAPECPKENQTISIHPVNSDAQLLVEIEVMCKCDCGKEEPNSPMCNRNGTLSCGECICNNGFSGQKCECNQENKAATEHCLMENSTEECSGRGSCECGVCVCQSMASNRKRFYTGTYCECDDYSCPFFDGALCGGLSRGVCRCGVCKCREKYEKDDCHCPTSRETCMAKNNKICNGHGKCECGICDCEDGFIGDTCDMCPTCNNWCEINKECVKCWMSKDGGSMEECSLCKVEDVVKVDKMAAVDSTKDVFKVCQVEIDKCIFRYQTVIQNGTERVRILKHEECPEANTTRMVIGIVVGILVLGILILVMWKLVTTFFDRRELARFNEERAKAAWTTQNNPLFIEAAMTYENPMLGS